MDPISHRPVNIPAYPLADDSETSITLASFCNVPNLNLEHFLKFVEDTYPLDDPRRAEIKEKWKSCVDLYLNTYEETNSIRRAIEELTLLFTEKYFDLNFTSIFESSFFSGSCLNIEEHCKQLLVYLESKPEQFIQERLEVCISLFPEYDGGKSCYLFLVIPPVTEYLNGRWEYKIEGNCLKKPTFIVIPFKFIDSHIKFIDVRHLVPKNFFYGQMEMHKDISFVEYINSMFVNKKKAFPKEVFEFLAHSYDQQKILSFNREIPKIEKKKKINRIEQALKKAQSAGQLIQPSLDSHAHSKSKTSDPVSVKISLESHKIKSIQKSESKSVDFIRKLEELNKKKVFYQQVDDKFLKNKSISSEKKYRVIVSVRQGKMTSNTAVGEGRTAHQAKQNAAENYLKGNITFQSYKKEKKPVEIKKSVEIKKIVKQVENVQPEINSPMEVGVKIEKSALPLLQTVSKQILNQENLPLDAHEKAAIPAKKMKKATFSVKKILTREKTENVQVVVDSSAKKSKVKEKSLRTEKAAQPIFFEELEQALVLHRSDSQKLLTDEASENKKVKKSQKAIFVEKFETLGHLVTNTVLKNSSYIPTPIAHLSQINRPTIYRDILNHSTIDAITAQVYNQQVAVYVMHKNLEQLNACYSTLTLRYSMLNGKNIKLKSEWDKMKSLQEVQEDDLLEEGLEFLAKGTKLEATHDSLNKLIVEEVKSNTFLIGNPAVEELQAGETIPTDFIKIPYDPETRVIRIQTTHDASSFKVIHKGGEKLELEIESLQQKIKFLEAENEKLQQRINSKK